MTLRPNWRLSVALGAVSIALSSQWFWASLYHGLFSLRDTLFAVAVISGSITGLSLLAIRMVPRLDSLQRGLILLSLIYLAYAIVRPYWGVGLVGLPLRVALALSAVSVVAWGLFKWSESTWHRVARGCAGFAVIFFLSFPLVGTSLSRDASVVFALGFLGEPQERAGNTLILLLDEFSPESAGPIVAVLEQRALKTQVATVHAGGSGTTDVIPAMLTGHRIGRAMPCGTTVLCTAAQSLDFSKLRAADSRVDVVAFFHPYCAIRELRSCVSATFEMDVSSVEALACALWVRVTMLPCMRKPNSRTYSQLAAMRKQMERSIAGAPFWRAGGLLYAHVPLPHPPADDSSGNLKQDYDLNIARAAGLVARMADKLRLSFGDDFVLVLMSDHALRVQRYCESPMYNKPNCASGLPENRDLVPLIAASPRALRALTASSNVGLLSGHRPETAVAP